MIGNLLVRIGIDAVCLCGHRRSEHDFDEVTPSGFCQSGNFNDGCSCMVYEAKGLRPIEHGRHAMTQQETLDFQTHGTKPHWMNHWEN